MEYKWNVLFTIVAFILVLVNGVIDQSDGRRCLICHKVRRKEICRHCKLMEVSQNIQDTQFNRMNPYDRDTYNRTYKYKPSSWSFEFWNYTSFITAAAQYQPYGFGTTYEDGGKVSLGKMEVAALLAHIGSKVTCEFRVSL